MLRAVLNSVSNSTAYGLPNLVKSKRLFHKLMWLFFMVSSTSASIWYIINITLIYFNYDTITVVSRIYEQPIQFPTISFCSYNFKSFENKKLSEIILQCQFGYDQTLKNNLENNFQLFYSYLGRCYRFNSGKNLTNHTVPFRYSYIGGMKFLESKLYTLVSYRI